jgi:type I restriction enzyme R subunit
VLKAKLMESEILYKQAMSNSKQQFADSPDLAGAILDAIMDALDAHSIMSKQALDSEQVRNGLRDILLGPGQLYETLRKQPEPGDRDMASR